MYGNNMNSGNGHAPFGYNGYRPSGGRMWGMSHSLPSGMSRYAFSPQDTDFNAPPFGGGGGGGGPQSGGRRVYNDFSGGGGGGHHMGSMGNMAAANSMNSLNNGMGGGSHSDCGGGGGHNGGNNGGGCNGTNLIVNYLPQDMADRELYALFRSMGPINTCRIMRDFKTGYSFGYAFVDFASEMDAQRAIKNLNGITVRHKRIKVSYARPGGESIKDTNLYVTNLPRTVTDDQLETIFGKYGNIVQKNILRDKLTGKPRGVAFIRFNKREEAQEAIAALNNIIPEGATQPLTVRLAEEHGKAKAQSFINQLGLGGGGGGGGGGHMHQQAPQAMNSGGYNNMVHRGRQNKSRFNKPHPYQVAPKFF